MFLKELNRCLRKGSADIVQNEIKLYPNIVEINFSSNAIFESSGLASLDLASEFCTKEDENSKGV